MIKKIKLQNFKSLVDIDLELKQLNVLIGPNASGKSNFLSFFRLLRAGAQERLNLEINSMGGIGNVMYYGTKKDDSLIWSLEFANLKYSQNAVYQGEIIPQGRSSYTLNETLFDLIPLEGGDEKNITYMSAAQGRISHLEAVKGEASETGYKINDRELVVSQIRDHSRYPAADEIRTYLADWQIYHGFGEEALSHMRSPEIFSVVNPLQLDPSGTNIVSILQELANNRRYHTINEKVMAAMQTVFSDFVKLYTPISAGGMGSLEYGSKNFQNSIPALNMSDGQLRFLGNLIILLIASQIEFPSVVTIDEPEIGMHPKMLEVFAHLLEEASQKSQIIITTHSSRLLDFINPSNVITVENADGKTKLEYLDTASLNQWLENYSLGKLWTMGALGK